MANSYATSDQLLARAPSLANQDDDFIDDALEASSRWIDGYCGRRFWLDPAVTDRYFHSRDLYVLDLGAFEIGSSTGVVVKTDDGTGAFATTLSASAYRLEPVNAPYDARAAAPYTTIRALSTSWPTVWFSGDIQESVKVTARFGWPAVPVAVRDACLTLTVDRVENPTGVRSEAIDGYSVRYGTAADADSVSPRALAALAPFRRRWAA